jgi:hypothetical protein
MNIDGDRGRKSLEDGEDDRTRGAFRKRRTKKGTARRDALKGVPYDNRAERPGHPRPRHPDRDTPTETPRPGHPDRDTPDGDTPDRDTLDRDTPDRDTPDRDTLKGVPYKTGGVM